MVLAVCQQKGGSGKTTLALHIAGCLALARYKVCVIDADPQGSALAWSAQRDAPPLFTVLGMPHASIHRQIPELAALHDHVIIDCPPRSADVTRSALVAADFVLIPVQPSPYDVWAAAEIVTLLHEVDTIKSTPTRAAFVINRKIPNTVIGRDVKDALAAHPHTVLNGTIAQRVIFAECAATGTLALEHAPRSQAAIEIHHITQEIYGKTYNNQPHTKGTTRRRGMD